MKKSMFIIALAVVAAACNNLQNQENTEEPVVVEGQEMEEATVETTELSGKEWKLIALGGESITLDDEFPTEPHIIFDEENNRVSGNAGCNGFGGNFELSGDDGMIISDAFSTQMACPNLEIEQKFLEVMRNVKHYHIDGNTLILHEEDHEGGATFQLEDAE